MTFDQRFDDASITLAMRIEQALPPEQDAAVLVGACCWMLADLILMAERLQQHPVEQSASFVLNNLLSCVEALRDSALEPRYRRTH